MTATRLCSGSLAKHQRLAQAGELDFQQSLRSIDVLAVDEGVAAVLGGTFFPSSVDGGDEEMVLQHLDHRTGDKGLPTDGAIRNDWLVVRPIGLGTPRETRTPEQAFGKA